MPDEKKNIDDLTDEEFDKLSEEGVDLKPKSEDKESEDKSEEESEDEKSEEESEDKESEDESEESEEDEEEEEDGEVSPFRTPHLPYKKYKKEKDKWEDTKNTYEEEITGMKKTIEDLEGKISNSTPDEMQEDIEKFTSESGLDKDVVMGLANIIKKYSGSIDPNVSKKIEEFEKTQRIMTEEKAFNDEFSSGAMPILQEINAEAGNAKIKEAKDFLKELSYKKKYVNMPLDELALLYGNVLTGMLGEKQKRKTVEGGQKRKSVDVDVPNDELTGEDWQDMSDEEFDKRSEQLEKQSPSNTVIRRKGKKIN